jgi:hypothetical protein
MLEERTRAVLQSSSLSLITVDADGLIKIAEGQRPPGLPKEVTSIVGQRFEDLWTDPVLGESVRRIFGEEAEVLEVDGVALDLEGRQHHHRYRVRLPSLSIAFSS